MSNEPAQWIEKVTGKTVSPLGAEVARVLDVVFGGIYHLQKEVAKADWTNPHYVVIQIHRGLSTFDSSELTQLVILCHDQMLRMEISPVNFTYLEIMFHQRTERTGSTMTRMPMIEYQIEHIRKVGGLGIKCQPES
jgi:hypothetical protein